MNTERPGCVNCGKPLGKYTNSVRVPFDRDVDVFIRGELKAGREYQMLDAYATVCRRQEQMGKAYESRLEQMEEARLKLAPGSNEPVDDTVVGKMKLRVLESNAKEPDPDHYKVLVRIWLGYWGPDRRGLFHSQACAEKWANKIAGRMRKEGKL